MKFIIIKKKWLFYVTKIVDPFLVMAMIYVYQINVIKIKNQNQLSAIHIS